MIDSGRRAAELRGRAALLKTKEALLIRKPILRLSLLAAIGLAACGDDSDSSADGSASSQGDAALGSTTTNDGGTLENDASVNAATILDGSRGSTVSPGDASSVAQQDAASLDAGSDAAVSTPTTGTSTGALPITAVHASRIGQNLHLEIDGTGFGPAPRTLPAVTELAQFGITDGTQGSWCAGRSNCPVNLQYTSWTDTRIVIDGFGAEYGGPYKMVDGDSVTIFVQSTNASSGGAMSTWTGVLHAEADPALAPGGVTPQIGAVSFSRIGQDMHIEVSGAGFGNAPRTLPADTEVSQFGFTDITQGGWCAGRNNCPVNLQYTSWTDTLIVIDGFGPEYSAQYKVVPADTVSLFVQNTTGPEFTVWTGALQAGTPPALMPGGPHPQVMSASFSQVGPNMQIQIDGAGFGSAPRTLPATTEVQQLGFYDVAKGGWCAGRSNCPVNLQYTSWSDTRIVIGGFGNEYGGQYTVSSGDTVRLYIQNTGGPEFTYWDGTLP